MHKRLFSKPFLTHVIRVYLQWNWLNQLRVIILYYKVLFYKNKKKSNADSMSVAGQFMYYIITIQLALL